MQKRAQFRRGSSISLTNGRDTVTSGPSPSSSDDIDFLSAHLLVIFSLILFSAVFTVALISRGGAIALFYAINIAPFGLGKRPWPVF